MILTVVYSTHAHGDRIAHCFDKYQWVMQFVYFTSGASEWEYHICSCLFEKIMGFSPSYRCFSMACMRTWSVYCSLNDKKKHAFALPQLCGENSLPFVIATIFGCLDTIYINKCLFCVFEKWAYEHVSKNNKRRIEARWMNITNISNKTCSSVIA